MPQSPIISVKKLPGSRKEITVEIPPAEADGFFLKALGLLSGQLELKGFRKGNVPPAIAEKYIRQDALFDEAAQAAIADTYPKILNQEGIEPIDKPEIEITKIAKGEALIYRARITVLPDIKLPNWRKIQVKRAATAVSAEELDKAVEYLRKSRAQHIAVTRPAQQGDFAEVDFTIRMNGVILENGSSQKHPLVIGEKKLMPGFEEQLIGMQAGDEKAFSLAFPADWYQKSYAGKTAEYQAKLVSLMERKLPELNDVFASSLGAFKTFAELETSIREGLLREKEEIERTRVQMEAVSAIAEKADAEIPDALVSREIEKMFEDLASRVETGGLTLESYLGHLKKTREELAGAWKKDAQQRVKIALVLRALAQEEVVAVSEEDLAAKIQELSKAYASPEETRKRFSEDALREYAQQVLANEKVLELIEKTCVVNP